MKKYPVSIGIQLGPELLKFETEFDSIEEAKIHIEKSKCVIANIYDNENNILHHFYRLDPGEPDEEMSWNVIPRGELAI